MNVEKLTTDARRLAANLVDINEGLVLHLGDSGANGRLVKDVAKVGSVREHGIDAQLQERRREVETVLRESSSSLRQTHLAQRGLEIGVELELKLGQINADALPLPALLEPLEVDAL